MHRLWTRITPLRDWLARDGLILAALLAVLLILFGPVTLGGRSLVPFDTLFQYPPWSSYADQMGVGPPHNALVTDLLLQNYVWKTFIVNQLQARELPLWNPHLFGGVPFLAAGQHSALYPLSVIYYVMPLWLAFGWFTVIQIWLAGVGTYAFARVLGLPRPAAAVSALTFSLGQLFLVNPVHPMILAGMSWLPIILLALEQLIRRLSRGDGLTLGTTLYASLGATAMALVFLAGHIEIALYTLLVAGYYTLCRLLIKTKDQRLKTNFGFQAKFLVFSLQSLVILCVVVLGLGLAAVQITPLFELVTRNFREGGTTLQEVYDYAFPKRHILKFLIPDIYGNPSHHGYYDIIQNAWVTDLRNRAGEPIRDLAWGIKNYAEGAVYAGLLPLLLALVALRSLKREASSVERRASNHQSSIINHQSPISSLQSPVSSLYVWLFAGLALISLLFAFGTPAYALLYALPGFSQLHTPFRWVFPYAFSLAMLAGFGWTAIAHHPVFARRLGWLAAGAGGLGLLGVGVGYLLRHRLVPLADRLVDRLARANEAFADGAAFLSYEGGRLLLFALFLTLSGLALVWLARELENRGSKIEDRGLKIEDRGLKIEDRRLRIEDSPLVQRPSSIVHRRSSIVHRPSSIVYRLSSIVHRLSSIVALAVLALDLGVASYGFNPATDPRLAAFTPPAIAWLQQRQQEDGPFRLTVLGDKNILHPNLAMLYGLHDARGYDSIIPRQYVDYARLIGEQDLLLYNQVAPLRKSESLDSPLLDLLGVRYVLTTRAINRPGWSLAYDAEIKIYRNDEAVPYAFLAETVINAADLDPQIVAALSQARPGRGLATLAADGKGTTPFVSGVSPTDSVKLISDTANSLEFEVRRATEPGLLIISDSFFPGWQAFLSPVDPSPSPSPTKGGESVDPSPSPSPTKGGESAPPFPGREGGQGVRSDSPIPIVRATGNFRAVSIPPGEWRLRLSYSPMSAKIGLYLSFLAASCLAFLVGFALWRRVYGPGDETDTVRRVARNSLAPMLTTLGNKVVDFAFAALMLRILGPTLSGRYYFAIAVVGYLEIWSNFGLNLYLTRQVAQNRDAAPATLAQTMTLRLVLLGLAVPVLLLLGLAWRQAFGLSDDTVLAILLLVVALIPGNIAAALSSIFYAYERMEYPAGLTSLTTLVKVALGAFALLFGWGFVGLAAVAILSNLVTVGILLRAASRLFFRPQFAFAPTIARGIVLASYPLMLNHLLQTLFFKVDVTLLQPLQGDIVVGWYSTAYKWIDALLIIPAYFTLAIFPLMSRLATTERRRTMDDGRSTIEDRRPTDDETDQPPAVNHPSPITNHQSSIINHQSSIVHRPSSPLARTYLLAVRVLLYIALPIAGATTFLAEPLIRLLGGPEFLPHGAIALRIMIWFLPFSFVNGVTQYVLVAVDQARWITRSFALAFGFNLIANLMFIPTYGYPAAAVITILSELVLMLPFLLAVHRHVTPLNPLALAWRPALATLALMLTLALVSPTPLLPSSPPPLLPFSLSPLLPLPWPLALLAAGLAYLATLVAVGGVTADDRALARRLLPGRGGAKSEGLGMV